MTAPPHRIILEIKSDSMYEVPRMVSAVKESSLFCWKALCHLLDLERELEGGRGSNSGSLEIFSV